MLRFLEIKIEIFEITIQSIQKAFLSVFTKLIILTEYSAYLIGPYFDGPNTHDFGKIVHN